MSNKPRNHHFVPRSWQNHFSPDGTVMVWAYDHVKQTVTWRSTKTTMQERDLYTELSRLSRRLFGLSQAASAAGSSRLA
jgi:hypothetical protein